jgi:hypothetical protein
MLPQDASHNRAHSKSQPESVVLKKFQEAGKLCQAAQYWTPGSGKECPTVRSSLSRRPSRFCPLCPSAVIFIFSSQEPLDLEPLHCRVLIQFSLLCPVSNASEISDVFVWPAIPGAATSMIIITSTILLLPCLTI